MSQSSTAVFVDNNKLTGHLPPQLGLLSSLMSADFRNNSLSCNGGTSNGSEASHCLHDELLPCFIRLTEATFPLPDASNMECPLIDRKPQDEARVACQGFGPAKLVSLHWTHLPRVNMCTVESASSSAGLSASHEALIALLMATYTARAGVLQSNMMLLLYLKYIE